MEENTENESSLDSIEEEELSCNLEEELTDVDSETNINYNSENIPFNLKWVWGINIPTGFINLTRSRNECEIFYTVSHIGVIFDYKNHTVKFLLGHKHLIRSISADDEGNWLATVGEETDCILIIWNRKDCIPVKTIFSPHEHYGVSKICLSGNAKYLVTVGNEPDPKIKFWLWTYGKETEDGVYIADRKFGKIRDITFNRKKNAYFAVTFETEVLFLSWEDEELKATIPVIRNREAHSYGIFNATTYALLSEKCFTATTHGWVLMWNNHFPRTTSHFEEISNNKIFIKAVRLQKKTITTIVSTGTYIATGDPQGNIKFYGCDLKLLYWCQSFTLHKIISMKFHLNQRLYEFKDLLRPDSERIPCPNDEEGTCEEWDDRSDEYEQMYAQLVPSDFTLKRGPFATQDFIILSDDGAIYYIDFLANKSNLLKERSSWITCLDVHDEKPHLYIGCADGIIRVVNYDSCKLIIERKIIDPSENKAHISIIKTSPEGLHLGFGTTDGQIWILNSAGLEPKIDKPFKYSDAAILKMCFSTNNLYFACSDANMAVTLFKCYKEGTRIKWIFHGRVVAHYKTIIGIVFCQNTRLVTIGTDWQCIEYNADSSEPGNLDLTARIQMLQNSRPTSFVYIDNSDSGGDNYFLISTDRYKYCLVEDKFYKIKKVTLAPLVENIVKQVAILPKSNNKYILFRNDNYIGINMLPITGNPFEYIAMILNAGTLADFCVSCDGSYVFTTDVNDNSCFIWGINTKSVNNLAAVGGSGLSPYFYLIEGGRDGWIYREIQDLFYYMQILHKGEDSPLPTKTSSRIAVKQIPNLIRALGFYPTEYELQILLNEVASEYTEYSETNEEQISFENLIRIYINHRPKFGIRTDMLKEAFNHFANNGEIDREKFINILCTEGEMFTREKVNHYLDILMRHDRNRNSNNESAIATLPQKITFDYFLNDILGVDEMKNVEDEKK